MGLFDFVGDILGAPGAGDIESGAKEGMAMSREQFGVAKEALAPYQKFGEIQGLEGLKSLMASPSSITETPWYQFSMSEGLRGLQSKALAGGKFWSGQTTRDVLKLSQGLASQEYGNEFARRFSLAQLGQSSAAALAGASVQTGNTLASLSAGMGQDLASAKGATVSGLMNIGGMMYGGSQGWFKG